jgi:hypothetical protein
MGIDTVKFHGRRLLRRDADSFFGLCLGMLSDGEVNQAEAEFLLDWLGARPELDSDDPLIGDIHWKLKHILADGVMDSAEALQLLRLLSTYTGCPSADKAQAQAATTLPLCDPMPDIDFADQSFCFTGVFSMGTRSDCVDMVQRFGGVQSKNITMKLDYLVIGHKVTQDWKCQSYGNKIIKAMKYRDEKAKPLRIVSEKHWIDSMRSALKAKAAQV